MKKKELKQIATKKQREMLKYIEDVCDVKFNGTTAKDVYKFIGEWFPRARKLDYISECISVPVVKQTLYSRDNSVYADADDFSYKKTVAHELLKKDVLHGRNAADALIDFQRRSFIESLSPNYDQNDGYDFDNYEDQSFDSYDDYGY